MNQINQTNKTNQLFDSLLRSQREIDRLAFPFEQQEDRVILGKTGSGLFIGLERAHRLAIDFENNIAFAHTHFLRRASGLDSLYLFSSMV